MALAYDEITGTWYDPALESPIGGAAPSPSSTSTSWGDYIPEGLADYWPEPYWYAPTLPASPDLMDPARELGGEVRDYVEETRDKIIEAAKVTVPKAVGAFGLATVPTGILALGAVAIAAYLAYKLAK